MLKDLQLFGKGSVVLWAGVKTNFADHLRSAKMLIERFKILELGSNILRVETKGNDNITAANTSQQIAIVSLGRRGYRYYSSARKLGFLNYLRI